VQTLIAIDDLIMLLEGLQMLNGRDGLLKQYGNP
jgi:hypothetical protein